jgi:hypothetical protein
MGIAAGMPSILQFIFMVTLKKLSAMIGSEMRKSFNSMVFSTNRVTLAETASKPFVTGFFNPGGS